MLERVKNGQAPIDVRMPWNDHERRVVRQRLHPDALLPKVCEIVTQVRKSVKRIVLYESPRSLLKKAKEKGIS